MSVPDYPLGETLDFKFTTRAFASGVPTTLTGGTVVIYEDNSLTEITTAETLSTDFDSVTGLNNLRIVATSGNGFESGKSYAAVISAGTVGGVSVVGEVVQQFTIERSPALRPTTAGRTLDVSAGGNAGIDWNNVETQGATVDLSATSINLVDTATAVTNDVGVNEWNGVALATTNPLPNAAAGAAGGLPTDSTGKTSFNDVSTAEVNAEVDTALADIDLDHLLKVDAGSWLVTAGSIMDRLTDDGTATFNRVTDSLQAIRDHIGDGTNLTEAGGDGDHLTEAGGTGDQLSAVPWNAAWDAEVESEVNDALDTAISELSQGIPTATPTLRTGLMLLYMALRNKLDVTTSGTDYLEIHNDAGTVIAKKALSDDGSDYSEAEMISGP